MRITDFISGFGEIYDFPVTLVNTSDPVQPLVYVNRAFEEMTGYTSPESLGRNCKFLQGPLTDASAVTKIREHIQERTALCQDILNYTKLGAVFYNRLVLLPFTENGVHYFIGYQHPISKEKFRPTHHTDHLILVDRIFNPLTIQISTVELNRLLHTRVTELEDLRQTQQKTLTRIRSFVLGL